MGTGHPAIKDSTVVWTGKKALKAQSEDAELFFFLKPENQL